MNLHSIPREITGPKLFWVGVDYRCKTCHQTFVTGHHPCAERALNAADFGTIWCECATCYNSITGHYHYTAADYIRNSICIYCYDSVHPKVGEHHYE